MGVGAYIRQHHVGLIAVFLALTGTAVAAFDPVGPDGDIDACFNKKTKALTLAKKKCKKGTKPVSWSQAGPQGATGPQGAQGAGGQGQTGATGPAGVPGADGTARGYGLVAPGGALSKSKNASVSRPLTGKYCVSVPGASPATSVIVLTPDFQADNFASGIATVGAAGGMTGGASEAAVIAWDTVNDICAGDQFEVHTGNQFVETTGDTLSAFSLTNEGFSFVVP